MKKILVVLAVLVVLVAGLGLGKNVLAKSLVEKTVHIATGLKLKMSSLKIGILKTNISINQLRLMNPKGFKDPVMLDVPEIAVDYNLRDIIGGNIHLEDVRFDLKEVLIVKNTDGSLNIDAIKSAGSKGGASQKSTEKPAETAKPADTSAKKPVTIAIDHLYLKIGRVVYKDYTAGVNPKVMTFDLNLNEEHRNITNINSLIGIIVLRVMTQTTLGAITNFDPSGLMSNLNIQGMDLNALGLDKFSGQASEAVTQAQGLLGSLSQTVGNTSKESGDGLASLFKSASESLQKSLKETN